MKSRRMTKAARQGLRSMASYWLTCLEGFGREFEDVPKTPEELAQINAALAYLGMDQIDLDQSGDTEDDGHSET